MERDYPWFRLARELHMPVVECMRTHSERQLELWVLFWEAEQERHDKADCYLAQIACEVRRVLMRNPNSISLRDFLLRYSKPRKETPEETKSRWRAFLGGPGTGTSDRKDPGRS